jgi:RNA polymerase sigma factor (TIGR02999 family)
MRPPHEFEITRILQSLENEELDRRAATDQIFAAVSNELRRVAAKLMSAERHEHTLQPTAVVNEAYLRLVDADQVGWQNRAHFFGIAARAMRQILVDHARKRSAEKRGGGWQRVTLTDDLVAVAATGIDAVELDHVLAKLAEQNARLAEVAELRILGGMTMEEIGAVLGVTERTVRKDWRITKMWLSRELLGGPST